MVIVYLIGAIFWLWVFFFGIWLIGAVFWYTLIGLVEGICKMMDWIILLPVRVIKFYLRGV
jgi:hypothetical protein